MQGATVRTSVTLVISGESLNPDELTKLLRIAPHVSKRKGDIQTFSSGKSIRAKVGLWEWRSRDSSASLSINEHIEGLANVFSSTAIDLRSLPNAENAWIDIHFVAEGASEAKSNICFLLDTSTISALYKLGLPVEITVDALSPA